MTLRSVLQPFRRLALGAVILAAPTLRAEEIVAFNTQTHKYHCLTCTWAIRCTVHCIKVSRSDAVKRGGVACKVCGGSCH